MRVHRIILLVVIALLIVGGVVLAQTNELPIPPRYIVKEITTASVHYRLANTSYQVKRISSGGRYQMVFLFSPMGTGAPCCCTFLPCTFRNR